MRDLRRRKALRMSAVAVVTGIAGCAAGDRSSPSPTDSSTPTETPIPAEQITEYESLTKTGQELFRTLLSKGSVERPSDEIPTKLREAEYLRYEGELYSISRTNTDRNVAEYTMDISPVDESEVDESELVAYADLSEEAKEAFTEALNAGDYTVRGETLPGKLGEVGFVKYDGDYYELRVIVADIRVQRLSITKVSE